MVNSPTASQSMPKDDFIKALLSSDRPVDAYDLLTRLPIDPYHRVADIGCGPGFFSVPLAKYLSHGKLYALDIDDEMLAVLRNRVKAARLGNVEILGTDGLNFDLPPSSLDGTLLSFVVHASNDKPAFLQAAAKLLKGSGWCCVLEWYRVETEHGPPLEKRIDPQEMIALGRDAGLTLLHQRDLRGSQYILLFKK